MSKNRIQKALSPEELLAQLTEIVQSNQFNVQTKYRNLRTWLEFFLKSVIPSNFSKGNLYDYINVASHQKLISLEQKSFLHGFRTNANASVHENKVIEYTVYLKTVNEFGNIFCQITQIPSDQLPDPIKSVEEIVVPKVEIIPDEQVPFVKQLDFVKGYVQSTTPLAKQYHLEINDKINGDFNYTAQIPEAFIVNNPWITTGTRLCLIDVEVKNGLLYPQYVVVEPDYLIDVTYVAESYELGLPPMYYMIKKWLNPYLPNGYAILGNAINQILDLLVADKNFNIDTFRKEQFFKLFALDLTYLDQAGPSMIGEPDVKGIYQNLITHHNQLINVIEHNFLSDPNDPVITQTEPRINKGELLIEPTFISPLFGIIGRLDLLNDRSTQGADEQKTYAFDVVELKSGNPKSESGVHKQDHFAQASLYHLMLKSAYGVLRTEGNVKLLYSGSHNPIRKVYFNEVNKIQAVIACRNNIVKTELDFSAATTAAEVEAILTFDPAVLLGKPFFVANPLTDFSAKISNASALLRTYILSWLRFTFSEQTAGKIGTVEDERGGLANLWLKDRDDKLTQAEVLEHLTIPNPKTSGKKLTLIRNPEQEQKSRILSGAIMQTIFRENERVILYPMPIALEDRLDSMSPVKNQIVKASIAKIDEFELVLSFNHEFISSKFLNNNKFWAIERDVADNTLDGWIRNITHLLNIPSDQLGLLLGQKEPQKYQSEPWPKQDAEANALSEEQQRLLRNAVASPNYFLLMGPPGTGKTRFMLKNLAWYYAIHKTVNVLLIAYTNRAVDEICEQLVDLKKQYGLNFIRIGHNIGTHPEYRSYLLSQQLDKISNRADVMDLLNRTNVFVGTASSVQSQSALFKLKAFDALIVDEASQMLEPFLMGFLTKVKKFILIGDHKQLPAVVTQPNETSTIADGSADEDILKVIGLKDMRISYFERMWNIAKASGWDYAFGSLTKQGRMHDDIGRFVSMKFYDGTLNIAREDQKSPLLPTWNLNALQPELSKSLFEQLNKHRVIFIDVPSPESLVNWNKSNPSEAKLVASLVMNKVLSLNQNFNPLTSIGVIAPFRNQVALIEQEIAAHFSSFENQELIDKVRGITIDTVEKFQGSQRDTIILSLTVTKPRQINGIVNMDFTNTIDRKLNVALSRAQNQLIVVGNSDVLTSNIIYKELLEHIKLNGAYIG